MKPSPPWELERFFGDLAPRLAHSREGGVEIGGIQDDERPTTRDMIDLSHSPISRSSPYLAHAAFVQEGGHVVVPEAGFDREGG